MHSVSSAIGSVAALGQAGESAVLRDLLVPEVQGVAAVPEGGGGAVQTVLFNEPTEIRPAGPAAATHVTLLVVPPKLEAAEGVTTVVFYAENTAGVQELLDLPFVTHGDLSHGWILRDKSDFSLPSPKEGISQSAGNSDHRPHPPSFTMALVRAGHRGVLYLLGTRDEPELHRQNKKIRGRGIEDQVRSCRRGRQGIYRLAG
jgi:hypothetical protein